MLVKWFFGSLKYSKVNWCTNHDITVAAFNNKNYIILAQDLSNGKD